MEKLGFLSNIEKEDKGDIERQEERKKIEIEKEKRREKK